MKIGVFDSGVGGLSVARAIEKALPKHGVIYVEDRDNIPYGTKTPELLHQIVLPQLERLSTHVDIIVIADQTVNTTLLDQLAKEIPVPLIGTQPDSSEEQIISELKKTLQQIS